MVDQPNISFSGADSICVDSRAREIGSCEGADSKERSIHDNENVVEMAKQSGSLSANPRRVSGPIAAPISKEIRHFGFPLSDVTIQTQ